MPLPKVKPGEARDKFIGRCMGDPMMKKDFKDQKQRTAVCFSQFTKKEGFFHVGGIVVVEAFFSLGDKLRAAVQTAWGKNVWVRDFSNKEVIMSSDDWTVDTFQKVGYKVMKGEIEFVGAPEEVELVKRYESQLTMKDLVDLAEMDFEVKDGKRN